MLSLFHVFKDCVCLFLAVLCLSCCSGFSPAAVSGSYSLDAVCGLRIAVASLAAEHRLQGTGASVAVAPWLSSCGSEA